jgi:hypothetical protein
MRSWIWKPSGSFLPIGESNASGPGGAASGTWGHPCLLVWQGLLISVDGAGLMRSR